MRKITKQRLFSYSVLMILLFGCIKEKVSVPIETGQDKCKSVSKVRKVLIIGIDGCRTDAFLAAHIPVFDSLMAHGYVNLNCDRGPYTVSGPGWSTILHGVFPAKHGVTSNVFPTTNYAQYPDLFYYMRKFNPYFNLAAVHRWERFTDIISNETSIQYHDNDLQVKTTAISLLNSCTPDVLFLHFEDVDAYGHSDGFSPNVWAYMYGIRLMGGHAADIMSAIEQRELNNNEEWLVFVVTDHGGVGKDHYAQDTVPETRFVFQIARLPNQSRVNVPVTDNTNIMPTILKYMGVPIDTAWRLDGVPLF
jgi:predicted AlkP superfamily pyrophosphatase or phosphodiesterase